MDSMRATPLVPQLRLIKKLGSGAHMGYLCRPQRCLQWVTSLFLGTRPLYNTAILTPLLDMHTAKKSNPKQEPLT